MPEGDAAPKAADVVGWTNLLIADQAESLSSKQFALVCHQADARGVELRQLADHAKNAIAYNAHIGVAAVSHFLSMVPVELRHASAMPVVLRPAGLGDAAFLTEMLVEAAFWRPNGPRGSVDDVLSQPELAHYIVGWPRPGDLGVVAEAEQPVGAAWLRSFSADDRGYGFVEAGTPEVAMGVVPAWRGRGVGAALLDALIVAARGARSVALSLSVEPDNPARRLYERFGFHHVGDVDASLTMLLRL